MALEDEIKVASKRVVKDGYDMSVGELMSLYRDGELVINPKYQRYFRWDTSQKTKFIESLLLGIPIPPIFVYTVGRKWELIDGLQRVSTLLEFAGLLKDYDDPKGKKLKEPLVLEGTQLLPSLQDKKWEETTEGAGDGFSEEQRFDVKRVRIRVEILKKESDPLAKYELFQRLNGGGSQLSEQELRSCVIVMINESFFDWLSALSTDNTFQQTIDPTERAEKRQQPLEWLIRYMAYRHVPYDGLDVHDYLDAAAVAMAGDKAFDKTSEAEVFHDTFSLLYGCFGANAFKKWDGDRFLGQTSLSAFECITHGVSKNIKKLKALGDADAKAFVSKQVKDLWGEDTFSRYSQAGVRGSTRLTHLLPLADLFFSP